MALVYGGIGTTSSGARRLRRPAWDNTVSDLAKCKLSKAQQERKREMYKSHNAERARQELLEKQERASLAFYDGTPLTPPSPPRVKPTLGLTREMLVSVAQQVMEGTPAREEAPARRRVRTLRAGPATHTRAPTVQPSLQVNEALFQYHTERKESVFDLDYRSEATALSLPQRADHRATLRLSDMGVHAQVDATTHECAALESNTSDTCNDDNNSSTRRGEGVDTNLSMSDFETLLVREEEALQRDTILDRVRSQLHAAAHLLHETLGGDKVEKRSEEEKETVAVDTLISDVVDTARNLALKQQQTLAELRFMAAERNALQLRVDYLESQCYASDSFPADSSEIEDADESLPRRLPF